MTFPALRVRLGRTGFVPGSFQSSLRDLEVDDGRRARVAEVRGRMTTATAYSVVKEHASPGRQGRESLWRATATSDSGAEKSPDLR
jgi:hypothetical protein